MISHVVSEFLSCIMYPYPVFEPWSRKPFKSWNLLCAIEFITLRTLLHLLGLCERYGTAASSVICLYQRCRYTAVIDEFDLFDALGWGANQVIWSVIVCIFVLLFYIVVVLCCCFVCAWDTATISLEKKISQSDLRSQLTAPRKDKTPHLCEIFIHNPDLYPLSKVPVQ